MVGMQKRSPSVLAFWLSRWRGVLVGLKVHADRDKSFHRWISKDRDTGSNPGPRSLSLSLPLSLSLSLPPLSRHTVAVQRAICALNRNALWNNARIPLATKDITLVVARVFLVRGGTRCRGLAGNLFLVSRVDLPRSDRIWKCLPDVAGDRLQFCSERFGRFFLFFLFFQTKRKKKLPDSVVRTWNNYACELENTWRMIIREISYIYELIHKYGPR